MTRPRDLSRVEEWDRRDKKLGPELVPERVVGGRRVDLACVLCGGVSSSSLCDRCTPENWNSYQSEYR